MYNRSAFQYVLFRKCQYHLIISSVAGNLPFIQKILHKTTIVYRTNYLYVYYNQNNLLESLSVVSSRDASSLGSVPNSGENQVRFWPNLTHFCNRNNNLNFLVILKKIKKTFNRILNWSEVNTNSGFYFEFIMSRPYRSSKWRD